MTDIVHTTASGPEVLEGEVFPPFRLSPDIEGSGEITVAIRRNPFVIDAVSVRRPVGLSILEIVQSCKEVLPAGFEAYGEADIDGHWVPRDHWHLVRPKPPKGKEVVRLVSLKMVPKGGKKLSTKNVLQIVGAIAILAAVAWVGGGALVPVLGQGFAAGTFGAQAAAAAVGTVGVIALQALSPAPTIPQSDSGALESEESAGTSINALKPLDYYYVCLGKLHVSPPRLTPSYTELDSASVFVTAVVGLAGEYDIEDIRVNNVPVTEFDGIEYEVRNGTLADAPLTIGNKTVIEDNNRNIELRNFVTKTKASKKQLLYHQSSEGGDPEQDLPQWVQFLTRGQPDEIWLRLVWPSGQVKTDDPGEVVATPFQLEIRERGDTEWIALPVIHVQDPSKGRKQMRANIKLKFGVITQTGPDVDGTETGGSGTGNVYVDKDSDAVYAVYARHGPDQTFEYQADDIFATTVPPCPMTSNTTGGSPGVTVSATSETGSVPNAYKAFNTSIDAFNGDFWQGTVPCALILDLGPTRRQRVASYQFQANIDNGGDLSRTPRSYTLEGSLDGTNWTVVDTQVNVTGVNVGRHDTVNGTPGYYRYYKFNVTQARDSGTVRVVYLGLFTTEGFSSVWWSVYARQVAIRNDGVDIYLDPSKFSPNVDYEVRIRRGLAYVWDGFTPSTYSYGSLINANFFDYYINNSQETLRIRQDVLSTQAFVEIFTSYRDVSPLNLTGVKVALIAVRARARAIESISATFTSRVHVWDAVDWNTFEGSQNGAALFRHVLTGTENAKPFPFEGIDDTLLAYAYEFCVTNGIEVNLLITGGPAIEEVIQKIASAMFAFVARSSKWGLIIDEDRTGEIISQNFTPLNSRSLTMEVDYSDVPHALYVQYEDEDQDYNTKFTTVYMDGYNSGNAVNYDSVIYEGITTLAGVQARALYDMRVAWYRNTRYRLTIGPENLQTSRGRLVGLTHDILTNRVAYTLTIAKITDGGGNVTGLQLEDVSLTEEVFNDAFAPEDIFDESNVFDIETALGAAITQNDGSIIVKPIDSVDVQNKTITFVTPWEDDDKIEEGFNVGIGPVGQEHLRCLISGVERAANLEATITLIDVAPEIHADPA